MIVEDLTPGHLAEWGDTAGIDDASGFVIRAANGELAAIGMVTWIEAPLDPSLPQGWWAWFDSRGPVSPLAHRYAVKVRNALKAAGASYIHAFVDEDIPRAATWLERLGFVPWRQDVWRLALVVDCEGGRPAGFSAKRQGAGEATAGHCE